MDERMDAARLTGGGGAQRESGSTQREISGDSPFPTLHFLFFLGGGGVATKVVSAQKATTCKHRDELLDL